MSLPADVFRRVDKVCQAFEAAWKSGQWPAIGFFLSGAEASDRPVLLRELVLLDIEYRQRTGEIPLATPNLNRNRQAGFS